MNILNIAWYNLENLFEPGQHPNLKNKWTQTRYNKKVKHLASVIAEMFNGDGPDLLGVCEVQSEKVMNDLIAELPNSGAYAVVHHHSPDMRLIDVGFIYRKSILSHPVATAYNIRKRYPTRDILKVEFTVNNGMKIFAMGNHWPSRSGGQYSSEPYRIMVAENCAWITEKLYKNDPEVNILFMGDLNDDPFNRSVQEYLYAIRNKERVQSRRNSKKARPYLYNLAWNMMDGQTPGTYFYSSNPAGWNMLDQIMVSKGLLTGSNGLEVIDDSFTIFRPKRIRDGSKPKPFRMKKNNTWVEGFSDHFAVLAKINIL